MRPITSLIVVLVVAPFPSVIAQEHPPPIEPGQRVRVTHSCTTVRARSCIRDEGTITRVHADRLLIRVGDRETDLSVPFASITKLETQTLGPLKPGQIQVRARGSRRLQAYLVDRSNDTLRLSRGRSVSVEAIDSLWVLGTSWKIGAVAGALIVGGSYALLAAAFEGLCEFNCPGEAAAAAKGAIVGGALGALVGAVVGFTRPKWNLRYPHGSWRGIPLGRLQVGITPQRNGRLGLSWSVAF